MESHLDGLAHTTSRAAENPFDVKNLYEGLPNLNRTDSRQATQSDPNHQAIDFGDVGSLYINDIDLNRDGKNDLTLISMDFKQSGPERMQQQMTFAKDAFENLGEAWQAAARDGDMSDFKDLFVKGLVEDLRRDFGTTGDGDTSPGDQPPSSTDKPPGNTDQPKPTDQPAFGEPVDYRTYAQNFKDYDHSGWALVKNTHNGQPMGYLAPGETYEEFFTGKSGHLYPQWLQLGPGGVSEAGYILHNQIPRSQWNLPVYGSRRTT